MKSNHAVSSVMTHEEKSVLGLLLGTEACCSKALEEWVFLRVKAIKGPPRFAQNLSKSNYTWSNNQQNLKKSVANCFFAHMPSGDVTQVSTLKRLQPAPAQGVKAPKGFSTMQALVVSVQMPREQCSQQFGARCSDTLVLENPTRSVHDIQNQSLPTKSIFDQMRTIVASNSSLSKPVATGMTNPNMSSSVPRAQPAPQIDMYVMCIS